MKRNAITKYGKNWLILDILDGEERSRKAVFSRLFNARVKVKAKETSEAIQGSETTTGFRRLSNPETLGNPEA
jgi:hypothetical protein